MCPFWKDSRWGECQEDLHLWIIQNETACYIMCTSSKVSQDRGKNDIKWPYLAPGPRAYINLIHDDHISLLGLAHDCSTHSTTSHTLVFLSARLNPWYQECPKERIQAFVLAFATSFLPCTGRVCIRCHAWPRRSRWSEWCRVHLCTSWWYRCG